ncbi:hypothetical protein FISHEDRAFT_77111 [Fistulina hepatica ATCC 64428]|uniref:Secreted protein n=1 Tax=Fistulina hepatica ATCC 64428 TaxID=1128425 RepID=A0A0D7A265_9AGAR|nr:hypothetical protein FISHEDRAFT_77111 [Fistulina hepatica ATCC 64428]
MSCHHLQSLLLLNSLSSPVSPFMHHPRTVKRMLSASRGTYAFHEGTVSRSIQKTAYRLVPDASTLRTPRLNMLLPDSP